MSAAELPWSFASVMSALASVEHVESTFVETKRSSYLNEDLVVSGTLRFTAPDKLEKRIEMPFVEHTTIHQNQIVIEREEEEATHYMNFDIPAAIRTIVDSIRATLAGDGTHLESYYQIDVTGAGRRWSMQLVPKVAELKKYLKSIVIDGEQERIIRIRFEEASGDRSEIKLTYQSFVTS